ncbi:MAG: TonB-dependent receptor [Burkholderiales bacterium]|nr:TonB-dependent receptor [Burkholderiales bacterium]
MKLPPISLPRRACLLVLASLAPAAGAQTVAANLADLSLEQLTNIEVTSVSKRVQRLADVAGSVYIINHEDIRRSGATSLPEALRLAPNLQVARADAIQYAITARGFNSVLANKMLVLIDGRTVYSPLFSGVFWEAQDVMLEDVERIEVLSGTGGTLYGSNAVNGVINIITRNASETHGFLASAGAGNQDRRLAARFGGATASGTNYRVFAQRSERENSTLNTGAAVRDGSGMTHLGFRADRTESRDQFTLQGDAYESRIDQAPAPRRVSGANLLGRWTRDLGQGSRAQLQGYLEQTGRDQPGSVRDTLDTADLEFQHQSQPWDSHEFLWGAGYRAQRDRVVNINPAALALLPADRRMNLANVFAQDEIQLPGRIKLTVGAKLEHNDYTGTEFLPNARLAFDVAPNHLLWGAVSRAVRTPSRIDKEFYSPGTPPFVVVAGGPNFNSEVARVYELGYRAQPVPAVSWSLTAFHHDFDRLRSLDAGPGGPTFNNNLEGRVTGVEAWGNWRLSDSWRLDAGYVRQNQHFQALAGTAPIGGVASLGNDPRYYGSLGLAWNASHTMEADVQVRRVGALPSPAVPAYTAVDLRWGWRVRPDLELSFTVRNLTDSRHPEWGNPASRVEIERSFLLKAVWRI